MVKGRADYHSTSHYPKSSFKNTSVYILRPNFTNDMGCKGDEWFHGWFDSRYYHLLYRHRDENEAQNFLQRLVKHLVLPSHASVIDLGCGKGRHSVSLHELGFDVLGIDLSKESIAIAQEKKTAGLSFEVQDMRQFTVANPVDCIMNLFTSFGYFDNETDNNLVIQRVREALVPGGYFVIDYFNSEMVQQCHGDSKSLTIQDIQFTLNKRIENNRVIKTIDVDDHGKLSHYEERVQLFKMEQLSQMLIAQDLIPIATFGDYKLNPFEASTSDRLIIIAKK